MDCRYARHDLINMSALGLGDKCFIAEEYVIKELGAAVCREGLSLRGRWVAMGEASPEALAPPGSPWLCFQGVDELGGGAGGLRGLRLVAQRISAPNRFLRPLDPRGQAASRSRSAHLLRTLPLAPA